MPKREISKLNRDNFTTWKSLMKLHLGSIGDHAQTIITIEHVDLAGVPTTKDMRKNKEHNQAILEIASALNYAEFDDIKVYKSTCQIWEAL